MEIFSYLFGLFTLPVVFLLWLFIEWLRDKNWEIDCLRCGMKFGEMGKSYKRLTNLKFLWHRWNGTCKRIAP